jgi:MFS family permease
MTPSADRVAAESWFLRRGLPSVLTPRARWRRLWQRSAPMLAGVATVLLASLVIAVFTGFNGVDIDDSPTASEWAVIVVLVAVVPLALLVGWLVSRIASSRRRRIASTVAAVALVASSLLDGSMSEVTANLVTSVLLIAAILVLNGLGVGSVVGWALRLTVSHLATMAALVTRALPVVLLTVLVFFNAYVWSMATLNSRMRIWLVIAFMAFIAIAFLVTGLLERARPILASPAAHDTDADRLAGTPFEAMADPPSGYPLTRGERFNVVFVVAASQILQIATVAVVTASIFFTLGLLLLSPTVRADWTKNGPDQGTVLGMTLPVPQALIHVTMFLGALTFMYVSARAVGDGEYRKDFLDPLVDDLRLTLVARNRYRARVDA